MLKHISSLAALALVAGLLSACGEQADDTASDEADTTVLEDGAVDAAEEMFAEEDEIVSDLESLDDAAERMVKLALRLGELDPDFVDAYTGPEEWRAEAQATEQTFEAIRADARDLMVSLDGITYADDLEAMRGSYISRTLRALEARAAIVSGEPMPFDEETLAIYDAVAPQYDLTDFEAAIAEIEALLPGDGPLNERMDAFRNSLAIPEDRMRQVFDAAIAECRVRTKDRIPMPEDESFVLEFVTDKAWSGYNWYQGDYVSLIQVNTDLPIIIDRAVDLGCHEGYPGHHTYGVVRERDFLRDKGWIEYSVQPLFGPQGPIAEGSANYGIELAFPGGEKITFERDMLFPMLGFDPADADKLDRLNDLRRTLSNAGVHFGRLYLDGAITGEEYIEGVMTYQLNTRQRAEQRLRFVEKYRSYIINYTVGLDIVRDYIDREAGDDEAARWDIFTQLLNTPITASDLVE